MDTMSPNKFFRTISLHIDAPSSDLEQIHGYVYRLPLIVGNPCTLHDADI